MHPTLLAALLLAALDLGLGLVGSPALLVRTTARGVLLLLTCNRLATGLFPEEGEEARAVTGLLLAYFLSGTLLRILDLGGGLCDIAAAGANALLALLVLRRAPPERSPGLPAPEPMGTVGRLAYALAAAWLLGGELSGWGEAVTHYDALNYHLDWPAQFRATGSLDVLVNPSTAFLVPFFSRAEALWSLFFLLPGAALDPLLRHIDVPFALGCVPLVALIARRMGVSAPAARAGAALLVLSPVFDVMSPLGGNDLALAFCLLASVWAALRWQEARGPAEALRFGLAVGMALATKYVALLFLPVLVAPLLAPPRRLPHLGAALLGLLLATTPDFGRNLLATGNPIYPTKVEVAGITLLPGFGTRSPLLLESEDFDLTPEVGERFAGPFWPLLVAAILLGPFLSGSLRARVLRGLSLLALVLFCGFSPVHYNRWLIAPLGLALAGALSLVAGRREAAAHPGGALTALVAVALLLALPLGERLDRAHRERLDTWSQYGAYTRMAEAWRAVEGLVPEDADLLILGDSLNYPYRGTAGRRRVRRPGDLHYRSLETPGFGARLDETHPWPIRDPEALRRWVKDCGADWIVLLRWEHPRAGELWELLPGIPGYQLTVSGRSFRLFQRRGAASKMLPATGPGSRRKPLPRVVDPRELRGL